MGSTVMEIIGQIAAALFGGSLVIQFSPIKWNPWTWLIKKLGKTMNEDMDRKMEEIETKIDKLEKDINIDKAEESRRRILRFADECRREERHSEEHFNEVIGDIKKYKLYCKEHPDFENDKCVMSIKFIEGAYEHCMKENDFLN